MAASERHPRRDGEDWLAGRPFTDGAHADEARSRLRDRRWWLSVLVACPLVGAGWEGAAALLGDGSFDLAPAIRHAEVGFVSIVVTTAILAAKRG